MYTVWARKRYRENIQFSDCSCLMNWNGLHRWTVIGTKFQEVHNHIFAVRLRFRQSDFHEEQNGIVGENFVELALGRIVTGEYFR